MYIYIYIYTYTHICILIYIYTHTHTSREPIYTYIYIYIYRQEAVSRAVCSLRWVFATPNFQPASQPASKQASQPCICWGKRNCSGTAWRRTWGDTPLGQQSTVTSESFEVIASPNRFVRTAVESPRATPSEVLLPLRHVPEAVLEEGEAVPWLRTNGVNTNGVAAKVMFSDGFEKVLPRAGLGLLSGGRSLSESSRVWPNTGGGVRRSGVRWQAWTCVYVYVYVYVYIYIHTYI